MKLSFPIGANKKEKETFQNLPCLGEISDNDFNYQIDIEPKEELRYAVRILLVNNNEICVEYSAKYDYIQIVGGGIEQGENIEQAARRETREETGYEISSLMPIGYFVENGIGKKSISFVFAAKPSRQVGTSYEDDEKECEFEPKWLSIEKAIEKTFVADNTEIKSYNGRFANKRDLMLLKFISENIKDQNEHF